MLTLTQNPAEVNADPAEEPRPTWTPTDPPAEADAAWWASENSGGCGPDELSPEDRRIASAQSALNRFWDMLAGEREATDGHERGLLFY